ncbi:hypothetical protein BD560DRAFT_419988 [Blakeslea trispora]|nr:hypothetical protein BD560DRAFT_419988 [Blakeslea trispora]
MSMFCKRCQEHTCKQCPNCQKVFECTHHCQKFDYYVNHIFSCPPSDGIKTADHLISAVFKKQIPMDSETLYQYGFSNCCNTQEQSLLLKLYENLVIKLGVRRNDLDVYCTRGKLLDLVDDKIREHQPTNEFVYHWIHGSPELLINEFTDKETAGKLRKGQDLISKMLEEGDDQLDLSDFFYQLNLMDRLRTEVHLQQRDEPKSTSSTFYQNPHIRVSYGYERQFSGYFLKVEDARLKIDHTMSFEMASIVSRAIDPSGDGRLFMFHTSPRPIQSGFRMSVPTLIEFMKLYNVPEKFTDQMRQHTK